MNNSYNNTFNQNGYYGYPSQTQYRAPIKQEYSFVNGIEGAKSYQIMPGQTMLLMDSDNPLCYMKISDSIGKCSLRYFKLEEISESDAKELLNPQQPQTDIFASKDDINNINKRLDELFKKIDKYNNKKDKID